MAMKMRTMKGGKKNRSMRMPAKGGKSDRSMRNPAGRRGMSGKGMSMRRKK